MDYSLVLLLMQREFHHTMDSMPYGNSRGRSSPELGSFRIPLSFPFEHLHAFHSSRSVRHYASVWHGAPCAAPHDADRHKNGSIRREFHDNVIVIKKESLRVVLQTDFSGNHGNGCHLMLNKDLFGQPDVQFPIRLVSLRF
jgi:hypothetical protein